MKGLEVAHDPDYQVGLTITGPGRMEAGGGCRALRKEAGARGGRTLASVLASAWEGGTWGAGKDRDGSPCGPQKELPWERPEF
jgi:hypothetical protein